MENPKKYTTNSYQQSVKSCGFTTIGIQSQLSSDMADDIVLTTLEENHEAMKVAWELEKLRRAEAEKMMYESLENLDSSLCSKMEDLCSKMDDFHKGTIEKFDHLIGMLTAIVQKVDEGKQDVDGSVLSEVSNESGDDFYVAEFQPITPRLSHSSPLQPIRPMGTEYFCEDSSESGEHKVFGEMLNSEIKEVCESEIIETVVDSGVEYSEEFILVNNNQRVSTTIFKGSKEIITLGNMEMMTDFSNDFILKDDLSWYSQPEVATVVKLFPFECDIGYKNDTNEMENSVVYWDINWWEIGKVDLSLEMVITSYWGGVIVKGLLNLVGESQGTIMGKNNGNSGLHTDIGEILYCCKESGNNISNYSHMSILIGAEYQATDLGLRVKDTGIYQLGIARKKLADRIAKLTGGVVVIKVGVATETNTRFATVMVVVAGLIKDVQVKPDIDVLRETSCSLNLASRVRRVEHGPAWRETDHAKLLKYNQQTKQDEKETKKLQDIVQALQFRLATREYICKNIQVRLYDLENQVAEGKKGLYDAKSYAKEVEKDWEIKNTHVDPATDSYEFQRNFTTDTQFSHAQTLMKIPETVQQTLSSFVHVVSPSNCSVLGATIGGPIMRSTPLIGHCGVYKGESAVWSCSIYSNPMNEASSKEFSLHKVCPTAKMRGVIGNGGKIMNQMRQDSGASIKVDSSTSEANDYVISIIAKQVFEDTFSPTETAMRHPMCSEIGYWVGASWIFDKTKNYFCCIVQTYQFLVLRLSTEFLVCLLKVDTYEKSISMLVENLFAKDLGRVKSYNLFAEKVRTTVKLVRPPRKPPPSVIQMVLKI